MGSRIIQGLTPYQIKTVRRKKFRGAWLYGSELVLGEPHVDHAVDTLMQERRQPSLSGRQKQSISNLIALIRKEDGDGYSRKKTPQVVWPTEVDSECFEKSEPKRLVGDPRKTWLYNVPVTLLQANMLAWKVQDLVVGIASCKGLTTRRIQGPPEVIFPNRRTTRRWGTMRVRNGGVKVVLYALGANVGTVIHEMCHLVGYAHDRTFKRMLNEVWKVYEAEYSSEGKVS